MKNDELKKLEMVYNALNSIEVRGFSNASALAGCMEIIKGIVTNAANGGE